MERHAVLLAQELRVLVVVGLLELVLRRDVVSVEAVASRRQLGEAPGAGLAAVVAGRLEALCDSGNGPRTGRRRLHVAGAGQHGDALADLGDAMLLVEVRVALGDAASRAPLFLEA